MVEAIQWSILAQYQASSGYLIELSIVGNMSLVSPILDNTCQSNVPPKAWKVLQPFHAVSKKTYLGMVDALQWSISAQYQASSGHLIELSIVGNIRQVSQILDNNGCSNIPTKAWKVLQPFHTVSKAYFEMVEVIQWSILAQYKASSGHLIGLSIVGDIRGVRPILVMTCRSNIPTKTWKVLQPFHAISKKTYFGMVEAIQWSLLVQYKASSGHLINNL